MKPYIITYTDKEGKKQKKRFRSGLSEILLIEPSQWYIDNKLKPSAEISKQAIVKLEHDEKVALKMKEIAERELEKEEEDDA